MPQSTSIRIAHINVSNHRDEGGLLILISKLISITAETEGGLLTGQVQVKVQIRVEACAWVRLQDTRITTLRRWCLITILL